MNKKKIVCGILAAQLSFNFINGGIIVRADDNLNNSESEQTIGAVNIQDVETDEVEETVEDNTTAGDVQEKSEDNIDNANAEGAAEEQGKNSNSTNVENVIEEPEENLDNSSIEKITDDAAVENEKIEEQEVTEKTDSEVTEDSNSLAELTNGTLDIDGVIYKLNHDNYVMVNGADDNLEEVNIPSMITVEGTEYQVTSINDFAFLENKTLKKVTINSANMYYIGFRSFYRCENLESITIPKSATAIGDDAFTGCDMNKLDFILEDESSKEVLENAGISTDKKAEEEPVEDEILEDETDMIVWGEDQSYTWSDNKCKMGYITFTLNDDKKTVSVTAYDKKIKQWVGGRYGSYQDVDNPTTEITVPGKIKVGDEYYRVTSINDSVFAYSTLLKKVTISKGIKTIGNSEFQYCGSLNTLIIPDTVTDLGVATFILCSLREIKIPGSVKEIKYETFYYSNITNVEIEEGVQSIDTMAFCSCNYLTNISIPDSIQSIDETAFEYSPNIKSVYASEAQYNKFKDVLCKSSNPEWVESNS